MPPKRPALAPQPLVQESLSRFQDELAALLNAEAVIAEEDVRRIFNSHIELQAIPLLVDIPTIKNKSKRNAETVPSPAIIAIENYPDSRCDTPTSVEVLLHHDIPEGEKGLHDLYIERLPGMW